MFSIIVDKNKDVRTAAHNFLLEAAKFLGEEFIDAKIKDQRPYLQETLRVSLHKFIKSKKNQSEIEERMPQKRFKLERVGSREHIALDATNESKASEDAMNKTDKVHLVENTNEKHQKSDIKTTSDKHLGIESFSDVKERTAGRMNNELLLKLMLKCVVYFSEPTDLDIRNLSSALNSYLSEGVVPALFSYQSETIVKAIELLQQRNVFNKQSSLAFFQYIYIRLFDTTRQSIFENMEKLLKIILHENLKQNTLYLSKFETTIVFNSLFRYFYSCQTPLTELVLRFVELMNINVVLSIVVLLLGRIEHQSRCLDMLLAIVGHFGNRISISKELFHSIRLCVVENAEKTNELVDMMFKHGCLTNIQADDDVKMIIEEADNQSQIIKTENLETIACSLIHKLSLLQNSITSEEVMDVTFLIANSSKIVMTKNSLCYLNLETRKRLILSYIMNLALLKSNKDKNLKYQKSGLISGEELTFVLKSDLRSLLKKNIEELTILNLLLIHQDIEQEMTKLNGLVRDLELANEVQSNFGVLITKTIENQNNVDFEEIFRVFSVFLKSEKLTTILDRAFEKCLMSALHRFLNTNGLRIFEKVDEFQNQELKNYSIEILKNCSGNPSNGVNVQNDQHEEGQMLFEN